MIDTRLEELLSLADLCSFVPPARGGKKCHLSTVLRWVLRGARAIDGNFVKLEAIRLGNRWMSSRAALQRFCEALTGCQAATQTPRSAGKRRRASEKAGEELATLGI